MTKWKITILRHKKSDLLIAVGENDLKGLVVHGRSEEELEEKLPQAAEELLREMGHVSPKITVSKESVPEFWPAIYNATLENELA